MYKSVKHLNVPDIKTLESEYLSIQQFINRLADLWHQTDFIVYHRLLYIF